MDEYYSCIARRTRRQTDLYWVRLLHGSSWGAEEKRPSGSGSSSKYKVRHTRRRRLGTCGGDPDFVSVSENEDDDEHSGSGLVGRRRRKGRRLEKRVGETGDGEDHSVEVIELDKSDSYGSGEELEHSEKGFKDALLVDEEYQNDKVENFDNVGCGCGLAEVEHKEPSSAKPVTIDLDGDSEHEENIHVGVAESSSEFDFYDDLLSSTDSEDDESSDEDYEVGEIESSSCEDGSISYDDDEEEEEEIYEADEEFGSGSEKACGKRKEKRSSKLQTKKFECFDEATSLMESMDLPMVEEQGRKVETESSGICRKKGDSNDNGTVQDFHGEKKASENVSSTSLGRNEKEVEAGELEYTPSSVKNDECGEKGKDQDQKERKDAGYASVTTGELQMKGCSTNLHEEEAKKAAKIQEADRVQRRDDSFSADVEVFSDYLESFGCSEASKDEAREDKEKQEGTEGENNFESLFSGDAKRLENEYTRRGLHSVSLKKEIGDSTKIVEGMENEKERQDNKESEKNDANANGSVNLDAHKRKEHPDKGTGVRSVSSLLKKQEAIGDSAKIDKIMENQKDREANKETQKDEAKAKDSIYVDADKRKEHADISTGVKEEKFISKRKRASFICNAERWETEPLDTDHHSVAVSKNQREMEPSNTLSKAVEQEHIEEVIAKDGEKVNDGHNSNNRKKNARVDKETGHKDGVHKIQRMQARPKELHIIELLAECFWGKRNAIKEDSNGFEEKDDDVHQRDTEPSACGDTLPLKFTFGVEKTGPVEKSESEKEMDMLWEEMESLLRFEEIGSLAGNAGTYEAEQYRESTATLCKHDLYIDEEIGIYCKICSWIATEIKYVSLPVEENFPLEGSGKRVSSSGVNVSLFDGVQFNVPGDGSEAVSSHNGGTVWDIIPDIKESMYPHQREGFEFIWTNLAGTIDLHTLKSADPSSAGGCIISHAPGTGKTRLTIVFLQTYLEVFPKCRPVVIAPASLLLTWEDEFKKWDIGIPFHNLNNLELSGKEHVAVINKVESCKHPIQNKDSIRMMKLFSWYKEKSILGISYNLYEKLAGGKSRVDVETEKKNRHMKTKKYPCMKENLENEVMRKVLRDIPGLLVLDEGHTPRNQRSLIWKVLSEIQTEKRIILSGTPFQNNFLELYNTLCLVKPSFPDRIPQELKKFCQSRLMQEKKASKGVIWVPVSSGSSTGFPADEKIHQLKLLMDPFVHVHKGSILQKSLPGLRDCVVSLKPDNMQKELLQSIECSQNTFKFEHKLALVSIHPSLFLHCSLSKKEESLVDRKQLEELKLNPYGGVKTRFLVEFVRLCEAVNEKVLVFSQFIDPLSLIVDQLKSIFYWSEGKEVLYMHGKLDLKQRQSMIHGFNDANSQAKVLLASTKACSEGINLIGASRVVLLDVVWNPSVERQAISRAYRLGQKRVVYTYHLITQGTTEGTKYCKQAEKDRLSELVFSARNTENDKQSSSAVVSEDKVLDQMIWHDKLKDMFGDCGVQPKERDLFETFGY